jgi:Tfp pilus assembly protein PilW
VRARDGTRRVARGVTLIELVVGMGIALLVLGACVGALAASARLVAAVGGRAEVEDTAQLAAEAFRFDARRAGFDPAASGLEALAGALPDQLTLQADLDADGVVDTASEEVTRWLCATGPPRLSRIIGAQSLPVAAPVSRCELHYLDAAGGELLAAGGLDAASRARVRRIVLEFAVDPASGGAAASRTVEVAMRRAP